MTLAAITLSFISCFFLLVVSLSFIYQLFFSPIRHIPGPFLARLTNVYRAAVSRTGKADQYYRKWHSTYGSAVRVGTNAVSIDDPFLIKVIYGTKDAWLKSEMYKTNDLMLNGQRTPNVFNTHSKAFHNTYSTPIRPFWSNTRILQLEPLIDETVTLFTKQIQERFSDGSVIMVDHWLEYLSWDMSANAGFGKHLGFLEQGRDVKGMISIGEHGVKYFAVLSQIPWLDEWLDKNPVFRIGPKPLLEVYLTGARFYQDYLGDLNNGKALKGSQLHFMDKYTNLKDTHEVANDDQIMAWLMLNIGAGADSTAGAMRSIIYHVAKHPLVYEALREELDGAVTSLPAQHKEVKDLPYLSAVIQESLRFTAPLGLMLERVVPDPGFTLPDGRFIPGGVKIGINPAVVTWDVEVFGTDADTFRPERWLKEEKEDEESFQKRHRRMCEVNDFVFGSGSRGCMGKHLVRMELWKIFATVYSAFDVKLTNPDHEWKYNISWFLCQKDIRMIVTPRQKD